MTELHTPEHHPAHYQTPGPRPAGASFVEFSAAVFVLALLGAFGTDACLLIYGAYINDSACRDAVKSAAKGSNYAKSLDLAQKAVLMHKTRDIMISPPAITGFDFESTAQLPPLGDTSYVRVTTSSVVRLPAPLFFYGTDAAHGQIQFSQTYAYPVLAPRPILQGHSWAACRPRITPRRMMP